MTQLVLLSLLAEAPFTVRGTESGVEVADRPVEGSGFVELRFVATTARSLEAMCDEAFGVTGISHEPHLASRVVLSEGADERITWDVIAPPMVSRRDYVVRKLRSHSAASCVVTFEAIDDPRHPPAGDVVRLRSLRGFFRFEAQAGGRVRVLHQVHMDPGGWLTPLVVEQTRQRMGVAWMKRLIAGGEIVELGKR